MPEVHTSAVPVLQPNHIPRPDPPHLSCSRARPARVFGRAVTREGVSRLGLCWGVAGLAGVWHVVRDGQWGRAGPPPPMGRWPAGSAVAAVPAWPMRLRLRGAPMRGVWGGAAHAGGLLATGGVGNGGRGTRRQGAAAGPEGGRARPATTHAPALHACRAHARPPHITPHPPHTLLPPEVGVHSPQPPRGVGRPGDQG